MELDSCMGIRALYQYFGTLILDNCVDIIGIIFVDNRKLFYVLD